MKSRNSAYITILVFSTLVMFGIKMVLGESIGWDFVSYPILYIPLLLFCMQLLQKLVNPLSIDWNEVVFPYTVLLGMLIIFVIEIYGAISNFIKMCIAQVKNKKA